MTNATETSVADPDLGFGMGKKSGSGSGMKNTDHISESLETIFWVKIRKFFDADPGRKKFGFGIDIPDPQHLLRHVGIGQ